MSGRRRKQSHRESNFIQTNWLGLVTRSSVAFFRYESNYKQISAEFAMKVGKLGPRRLNGEVRKYEVIM